MQANTKVFPPSEKPKNSNKILRQHHHKQLINHQNLVNILTTVHDTFMM